MYILAGCFYAPVKYGAAQALENYLLYYLLFIAGMLWKWEKRDAFIWAASMVVASITAFVQYHITNYPISTFGNPNFFAGHLLMPIFLILYFVKKKIYSHRNNIWNNNHCCTSYYKITRLGICISCCICICVVFAFERK